MTMIESTKRQISEEYDKVSKFEKEMEVNINNLSATLALTRGLKKVLRRIIEMEESLRQQLMGKTCTSRGWVEV